MIYEELKNLISRVRSDYTVQIFDEAVGLFELMGQDDYMSIFEATVGASSLLSDNELIDALLTDLHVIVDNILAVQGVRLIEEVLASDKIKIAKGLLAIFDYSDRAGILRILETDYNPEEKIAELLSLVTDMSTEDIFINIQEVNPAVPTKMIELIHEEANQFVENAYNKTMKSIVDLYVKFKENLLEKKPFFTDKYLMDVSTLGMSFEYYLEDTLQHPEFKSLLAKLDTLTKMSDEATAQEVSLYLIGMAILCIDGQSNPNDVIRSNMHLVTNNINTLGILETHVSKNLIKLTSTGVGQ